MPCEKTWPSGLCNGKTRDRTLLSPSGDVFHMGMGMPLFIPAGIEIKQVNKRGPVVDVNST